MASKESSLKDMGNGVSNWSNEYLNIKQKHDEAYKTIEEAIKLEEREEPNAAVQKYKEGIVLIDKALNIVITYPENADDTWKHACEMIQKMKETRAEVQIRINSIVSSPTFIPTETAAIEDELVDNNIYATTSSELITAINDLKANISTGHTEIIYSYDGVQVYFISALGHVLLSAESQTLSIALIEVSNGRGTIAYLQINNWLYPLISGVSPCYRTEYGAIIFPDVHSDISGSSVGIILPESEDVFVLGLLEDILRGIIYRKDEPLDIILRQRRDIASTTAISTTISAGLSKGAYYISNGLIFGARKAGDLINYGTPKIINSLAPAPPSDATPIPENVTKGIKIVNKTTGKAAEVTEFVAEKIGVATAKLGHFLAPHIQKQGTRFLTTGFNLSETEASEKVGGVLTVAAGAMEGFSTIYRGLETSSKILGANLKENSVKIVEHKYGRPTGELADNTLSTVGNVLSIRGSARILTPKGLAKITAKETGRALVKDHKYSTDLPEQRQEVLPYNVDNLENKNNAPSTS